MAGNPRRKTVTSVTITTELRDNVRALNKLFKMTSLAEKGDKNVPSKTWFYELFNGSKRTTEQFTLKKIVDLGIATFEKLSKADQSVFLEEISFYRQYFPYLDSWLTERNVPSQTAGSDNASTADMTNQNLSDDVFDGDTADTSSSEEPVKSEEKPAVKSRASKESFDIGSIDINSLSASDIEKLLQRFRTAKEEELKKLENSFLGQRVATAEKRYPIWKELSRTDSSLPFEVLGVCVFPYDLPEGPAKKMLQSVEAPLNDMLQFLIAHDQSYLQTLSARMRVEGRGKYVPGKGLYIYF